MTKTDIRFLVLIVAVTTALMILVHPPELLRCQGPVEQLFGNCSR